MIETEQLIYQQDEENKLVKAAVEGSRSAFDQLIRRHSTRVYKVALAMLGNREDAEDIQQEVFVRAYRNLGTFRGQSSFGTWLHSITARSCLTHRRGGRYKYEELYEEVPLQTDELNLSPESIAIATESSERVRRTLGRMKPNDRLLIVLKYVDQFDHKEIAEVLGCSEESSRSRLTRAKKLFRDLYGKTE